MCAPNLVTHTTTTLSPCGVGKAHLTALFTQIAYTNGTRKSTTICAPNILGTAGNIGTVEILTRFKIFCVTILMLQNSNCVKYKNIAIKQLGTHSGSSLTKKHQLENKC